VVVDALEHGHARSAEASDVDRALNRALREQVRRNRERDERLREQRRKAAT
jgi:hypothetical protein